MIKSKRIVLLSVLMFILLCVSAVFVIFSANSAQYASAEETVLSDADYTDDDRLLLSNGTNSDKNITDFATEVVNSQEGTYFPELAEVLPRQFLESSVTNDTHQYYGKEYGYYIAKEDDYFDVLLIDFVYENTDNSYKIEIKPILQQTFERETSGSGYIWKTYNGSRWKYYVAQPRFVSLLTNENALNYGDPGYFKENDEGLIIQQSRTNYGKILYKTKADKLEILNKFAADKLVGIVVSGIDALFFKGVGITAFLKDCIELGANIYYQGREEIVKADNEHNICTNPSKTDQREDETKDGYTRFVSFMPQEEIILSAEENSYANFIAVLNDTNYRSRFLQMCEFDIVRRDGNYSSMEHVAGNYIDENAEAISFSREQTLFDDQDPQTQLTQSNFNGVDNAIYLLPYGKQYFYFSPQYSSDYIFSIPAGLTLSVEGVDDVVKTGNSYSVYLREVGKDKQYKIIISNNTRNMYISYIQCSVPLLSNNGFTVGANDNYLVKFIPSVSGYQKIVSENYYSSVKILDSSFNIVSNNDTRISDYYFFIANSAYYILVHNTTANSIISHLSVSGTPSVKLNESVTLNAENKVVSFTNTYQSNAMFTITVTNSMVSVVNSSNRNIATVSSSENKQVYSFTLSSNEKCFIIALQIDTDTLTAVRLDERQLRWEIDGNITVSRTVSFKSETFDTSHSIRLVTLIDGIKVYLSTDYTYSTSNSSSDCVNYDTVNNILTIKSGVSRKEYSELHTSFASDFTLSIEVWSYKVNVTLKCEYESGPADTTIIATYNEKLPSTGITIPKRTGYIFLGYYTEANGYGKQYYDENLVGQTCDKDEDFTLYAFWEKAYYTITFYAENDYGTAYYYVKVAYGEPMPLPSMEAPKLTGYEFVGYFSQPNGKGTKYYSMTIADDTVRATENAVEHYYYEKVVSDSIWNIEGDATLYAHWKLLECSYTYSNVLYQNGYLENKSTVYLKHGTNTITAEQFSGYTFKYFMYNNKEYTDSTVTLNIPLVRRTIDKEINPKYTLFAVYDKSCLAEGSLISLADGTQVPVEKLTGNELLLVWNLSTGTFDSAKILFMDSDPARIYEVVYLHFSDGTLVKIIAEHAFWDFDLNQYVYLRRDAAKYIGHWFNKQITQADGTMNWMKVQLTNVEVKEEYTSAWSPVTESHLCYYVNGMLSLPGGITGLFNIFDVDSETLKFNESAMREDIERYGLFTYEEFAEKLPVSEEIFNAFNGQFLKVAIGKGLIDYDTLQYLTNHYSKYFN